MAEPENSEIKKPAEPEKPDSKAEPAAKEDAADKPQQSATAEPSSSEEQSAPAAQKPRGKRGVRTVSNGVAHIRATFNNTIVSITDPQGGVVAWSTAGRAGFKGSRKSTAFAATLVGQDAARQAAARGMNEVEVRVRGAGTGRESAIRALQSSGLNVSLIVDVTPMPHNGCRARKRRRV